MQTTADQRWKAKPDMIRPAAADTVEASADVLFAVALAALAVQAF